jgi:Na+/melibiose symporter-like transporter
MKEKGAGPQGSPVRALSIFVNVLWVGGIILLILNTGHVLFMLLMSPSPLVEEKGFFYAGSMYFAVLLSEAVFLWIIYHLRKLLKTVEQGNPFERRNPVWIRHIAYGFLFWIPFQVIETIMSKGISYTFKTDYWVGVLFFKIMLPLFIGMVILVIARVFEAGVRMQQDQSLTI